MIIFDYLIMIILWEYNKYIVAIAATRSIIHFLHG